MPDAHRTRDNLQCCVWVVTHSSPVLDLRHISGNVSVWKSPVLELLVDAPMSRTCSS